MFWGRASNDALSNHQIKVPNLQAAINVARMNGWGIHVIYPRHRWHVKKSYGDNYKWKGHPKDDETME